MRISTSEITAETIFLPVISIYWQTKHCIVVRRSLLGEYKLSLDTLTAFGSLDREGSDGLLPYSNSDNDKPLHVCHTRHAY